MPALSNRWNIADIHRTIADIGLLSDSTFDADTTPGCESVNYNTRDRGYRKILSLLGILILTSAAPGLGHCLGILSKPRIFNVFERFQMWPSSVNLNR
jgi:hypothetical protein